MKVSSARATLVPLLLIATTCTGPEPFREGVRIGDRLYPGATAEADGMIVTRLVDDLTGQPVVGAEVFLVDEHNTPIAGEFWFTSRFVSDGEGFVRLEVPPGARSIAWQAVRHPTCGVATRTGTDPVWRLGRGFDVPLRIVDWLGRPAAGARVGFCGGCGHTPDLVNATADADGLAVLRDIEPRNGIADLYVQHPGLHYFYDSVDWRPGEGPQEVRCEHAPPLTGRLVDHQGRPVAGAFVCGGSQHRGPWARTAADGSFTVLGAKTPTYPHHVVLPGGRDIYFDTSNAWPVTLRLPDLADPKAFEGVVEDEPPAPPAIAAREVRVVVEGAPGALDLGSFAPGMSSGKPADGHVLAPARGPFVVVASQAEVKYFSERRFVFAEGVDVPDPIVVRWVADVRLCGRAIDSAGRPVAVNVRVRSRWWKQFEHEEREELAPAACADGVIDLACARTGTVLFEIAPIEAGVRPRLLWVDVPPRGAKERVELGPVVVGGDARLRVVDGRGAPLPEATVGFARPGWQEAGHSYVWPLAPDGSWNGPDLRAGDTIVVQAGEAAVPNRTVLSGDGPWTIVAPEGQLDLAVVDEAGQGLAAVAVFADHDVETEGGAVRLRGLPLGQLRVYVTAPEHGSAIVDAQVTAAPQSIRVVLPKR